MCKQNVVVSPVLVAVVVVAIGAGGQAAELPNHLKEDTISKDLYEPSAPIVSVAAAARNAIVSIQSPGPANPSAKILNAVAGDSAAAAAAVRGKDSSTVVEGAAATATTAVKDSVIATVGNTNEAATVVQENDNNNNDGSSSNNNNNNNNNEQRETNAKPQKLGEKSPSIPTQTAHSERLDNNEHSVGERIEKVMPVKENTVATHVRKGGSSSSLKVAAQMVGVYQHNKR